MTDDWHVEQRELLDEQGKPRWVPSMGLGKLFKEIQDEAVRRGLMTPEQAVPLPVKAMDEKKPAAPRREPGEDG